ncbi:sugar-binding protein [Virgibacillus halophilus]|uniref:sugar-binding protein n=1 Tax=Tigheibacillus halophilus TaxID=361280 RepID=UPI003629AA9A
MNNDSKFTLIVIGCVIFFISLIGMIIYGYKTFAISPLDQKAEKDYSHHFALVAEENENDYWRLVKKGAEESAEKNHVNLEYVAPKKADNDELNRLLDRMIAAKMDGIIVQGIKGQRFKDLVHKSVERDIPIVTVDTDAKASERKAYVGTNNIEAGKLLGKSLLENTSGEQYVGIITGRNEAINQQERIQGFREMVKGHKRIHIIAIRESHITKNGATIASYKLLKQYPKINAFVGMSALDGPGIVEGVKEVAPFKNTYVLAFDTLPETMQLMKAGKIDATVAQYPEQMGNDAVEVLIRLQGKDLLDNLIYTKTNIITKEDVQRQDKTQ